MKVYEYNEMIDALLSTNDDGIDEETGMVFDAALLDQLEMERSEKLENLLLYVAQMTADADEIKAYADKLTTRANSKKNKADRIKEWLCTELPRYGDKCFETAKIKAVVVERKKVNIVNEKLLPPQYIRTKTETAPDKNAIAAAIKAGKKVDGAEMIKSQSLQIK